MRQLKIIKQVTNRETASLDKYLQDIGRIELITPEDEVSLAQKIRQGDHQALKTLVKSNLRFVVSVAKQYQNQGLNLPDLINEGNIGLMKAAERFDETKGFKFISYAVWWIRQSILQALAEQGRIVRLPLNKISSINKVKGALHTLEQIYQRQPTTHEIATYLKISEKEVKDSIKSTGIHISMDAPLLDGEDVTLYDVLPVDNENPTPEKGLLKESLKKDIERAISRLRKRESDVIRLYFGLGREYPMSLEEIGEVLDLTRERIRQIKEKAIRRLKQQSRSKVLKSYL